jgi:hypothetical protein
MRSLVWSLPLLVLVACGEPAARVEPTPAEAHLLKVLRADPAMLISSLERQTNGTLIVTTQQGDISRRYSLTKVGEELRILPIEDRVTMHGPHDGQDGTGPDARGLATH